MDNARRKRLRDLRAEHKSWLSSQGLDKSFNIDPNSRPNYELKVSREVPYNSSHNINGPTNRSSSNTYTGSLIKGIATMHKSNAIPILNEEQAIEISKMRRN